MALRPIDDRQLKKRFARFKDNSRWLLLAVVAVVAGCDSRQVIAQASVTGQPRANAQTVDAISGDPVRGQEIAQEKCGACHGADGNSSDPHIPKLAGQSLPYLYWEIRAYKEGIRKSDVMTPNASALPYEDIADVATYFSGQMRKPDGVNDQSRIGLGESLFYSRMPSCAMCHSSAGRRGMPMMGGGMGGMKGDGMGGMMGSGPANVPNLQGQHAAYIVDQLNRFATGERQGVAMNRVAARLGDTDKQAIAEFLSNAP